MRFLDREHAGKMLASLLLDYRSESPVVLGLPRGGLPVAKEVARALEVPLDVWVVRKIGAPGFDELGIGAVAEGGAVYLDPELVAATGATEEYVRTTVHRKLEEVAMRASRYRGPETAPPIVENRTVILVDDGIATGGTMRAVVQALRTAGAAKVVVAVPIAATESLDALARQVDRLVCVQETPELHAIGAWYEDFRQVSDEEVVTLLREARGGTTTSREVRVPAGEATLEGTLSLPPKAVGLVLFAHGSGSSRASPRNRRVAAALQRQGFGTLLFDLLTLEEEAVDEETGELRFDVGRLARRLLAVTDWAMKTPGLEQLPIGYFGASTGAAAALVAAAERPGVVHAVVSRGGRPDLAQDSLGWVRAPTLLIVGARDRAVLGLNRSAYGRLGGIRQLEVVPGATHLFEEPGAMETVAQLAGEWFTEHLKPWGLRVHPGQAAHAGP